MSENKIIIFDLDDTLYPEITFVYSGFKAVSKYLSKKYNKAETQLLELMIEYLHEDGRGKIFDRLLRSMDIPVNDELKFCIKLYRYHNPEISLFQDAVFCLNNIPMNKYLVTDGNKLVQQNKINALGIKQYFKKIYLTHQYGLKYEKPSIFCFNKIKDIEKCSWSEMIYVGDNPKKDFVGLNKEGMKTIRIHTGTYKNIVADEDYDGQYHINHLSELPSLLKKI